MARTDELAGNTRYRLAGRIGSGGMGIVYQAYDRQRETTVALKMLTRMKPILLAKFKNEFRALADVHHPNLITLYDLEQHQSRWFFTMELVDGSDFIEHVRLVSSEKSRPISKPTIVNLVTPDTEAFETLNLDLSLVDGQMVSEEVHSAAPIPRPSMNHTGALAVDIDRLRLALRQLVEGIYALHNSGQLHCDIKPSNVLVTRQGRVVILDFGLVTDLGNSKTTNSGEITGTPAYMAPEQARLQQLSPAADWYAVGGMLYTCLTGTAPFSGSIVKMLYDKQHRLPTAPKALVPAIPDDLNRLAMSLLAHDPAARPSGREILAMVGASPNTQSFMISRKEGDELDFIGRHEQLQALAQARETVATKHGVSVYISAQSGLGKTALVRKFAATFEAEGGLILQGRCYEREAVPFKAIDAVIDNLADYLVGLSDADVDSILPESSFALSKIFPVLGRIKAVNRLRPSQGDLPPLELRRVAASALRLILTRIAKKRPLAVLIDDLQWGDIDSAQFLATLVRPPDAPRILLLMSYRSDEASSSPLLDALNTRESGAFLEGDLREVKLEALSEHEATELALKALGANTQDAHTHATQIAKEARGHPYFVRVLAEVVGKRGSALAIGSLSLDDILWNEVISNLPQGTIALLNTIAVAGRPISWEFVHQASTRAAQDHNVIIMLRKLHLIRTTGANTTDHVEPYHDRIRETIVRNMSDSDRKEQHLRLAHVFESTDRPPIEALAFHFYAAGSTEKACFYAREAALRAQKATAFDREAKYLARVIELERPQESDQALDLHERLGNALVSAGQVAQGAAAYIKAAAYAPLLKSRGLRRRAAQHLLESGREEEGEALISECLKEFGMTLPANNREATLNIIKSRIKIALRGGVEKYTERAEEDISPEELEKIDLCWATASGFALGEQIKTADFQNRHLLLALRAGEPMRIGRSLTVEAGTLCAGAGQITKASTKLLDRCFDIAKRFDNHDNLGFAHYGLGMSAHLSGLWPSSLNHFQIANEVWRTRCHGMSADVVRSQAYIIHNLHMLGEIREMTRTLPNMIAGASERDDHWGVASLQTAFCISHWLALDDLETAQVNCGDMLKVLDEQHMLSVPGIWQMVANAYTAIYGGEAAWIGTLACRFDQSWPALRRGMLLRIQLVRIGLSDAVIRLALGALSKGCEDADYENMILRHTKKMKKENKPQANGYAAAGLAGLARHQGRFEDEHRYLSDAIKFFDEAEMSLCKQAARWRLGELRGQEEGEQICKEALEWAVAQSIAQPERMFAIFNPYDLKTQD